MSCKEVLKPALEGVIPYAKIEFLSNKIADRIGEGEKKPRMMVCEDADKCSGLKCSGLHCKPHAHNNWCGDICVYGHKCVPVEDGKEKPLDGVLIEPLNTEHDVEAWRMTLKINELVRAVNELKNKGGVE